MKKFKQLLVPAVVVLMGAGAAFATNAAKDSDTSTEAYYLDSSTSQCIKVENVECVPSGTTICTWTDPATEITHNLRQLDATGCSNFLYRP